MRGMVTVEVDVNAGVEEAYALWCRMHPEPEPGHEGDGAAQHKQMRWVVRVDGVQKEYAHVPHDVVDAPKTVRWAGPEGVVPRGEVAFDELDTEHTRVGISLEWQRPDHGESFAPLILLDGVQVRADLRKFKHDLERIAHRAEGWEETMGRFERL